ncbi:MAG: alpha/beta fold hydrolase [Brumimicrobium sp.]
MNLINQKYLGAADRKSLLDFQEPDGDYEHIIVFIHGYKGFKDWGAWNLVQSYFVGNGIGFCKFNMSHNGGTIENPIDFPDLEAFSINRYTYEVKDILNVLDWIEQNIDITNKKIHLFGHSRGGGIATLAARDYRVASVSTLASISDISTRFPSNEELEKWKKDGVYYVKNARTNQDMPHKYVFYEDWLENRLTLNIEANAKHLKIPALHIHGDKDGTVPISDSENLSNWTGGALYILNGADHTFDSYHPYDKKELPNKLNEAVNLVRLFVLNQG